MKHSRSVLLGLIIGLFVNFLIGSSDSFAKRQPATKVSKPSCVAVTNKCSVCTDGKYRETVKAGLGKELKADAWMCVNNGKLITPYKSVSDIEKQLELTGCKLLSSFCAICPADGKNKKAFQFVFLNDGKQIESNLYECRTRPQTLVSKASH